jgi:hypothetical protein
MDLIDTRFYVNSYHLISSTKSDSMNKIDNFDIFLVLITILNNFFEAILFMLPHLIYRPGANTPFAPMLIRPCIQ